MNETNVWPGTWEQMVAAVDSVGLMGPAEWMEEMEELSAPALVVEGCGTRDTQGTHGSQHISLSICRGATGTIGCR